MATTSLRNMKLAESVVTLAYVQLRKALCRAAAADADMRMFENDCDLLPGTPKPADAS